MHRRREKGESEGLSPRTDSHTPDKSLNGTLAARVDGVPGDALGLAGDGPHEDQAAADLEVLVGLAGDEELAARVDGEDAVKLLGGDVLDVAERDDAAVGADNVELAKLVLGLLEEAEISSTFATFALTAAASEPFFLIWLTTSLAASSLFA